MDVEILLCVIEWLFEGVNVERFFVYFKGNYRGKVYDFMNFLEVLLKIFLYVRSIVDLYVVYIV